MQGSAVFKIIENMYLVTIARFGNLVSFINRLNSLSQKQIKYGFFKDIILKYKAKDV